MPVKAYIADPATGAIAKVAPDINGENRLHVDAVIDTTAQQPIQVVLGVPVGAALPRMLSLWFSQTVGAVVASQWARALTYTVPVGFNGYLVRYTSFQAESASSRVISELLMGTLNLVTNAFVGSATSYNYIAPQWSGIVQCEVTTAVGSVANVVVTVTYTNDLGVSARTGTFSVPKSSIIGTRIDLVLQAGDLGVRSIEDMSTAPTSSTGSIKVLGFIELGYHEDAGTAAYETLYSPGAVSFASGTIIGIEFNGGAVSKARRFDVGLQLLQIVGS